MNFAIRNKIIILSLIISILGAIAIFMNLNVATPNNNQNWEGYYDNLKIANPYTNISPEEAFNMINDDITYPDLVILDVRSQGEYDTSHLCGAILIPHTELEARIGEVEPYKDTEIIVYCGSGVRSATACGILESHDFTKVFNMVGGITAWISDGYGVCTDDLTPPMWGEIPTDQFLEYGESFSYDLDAYDSSGIDEWWLNDTMYFDIDGNGLITNNSLVPIGEYWLEVSVNDTYGNTLTDSFKITIQDITSPSWVQSPSDKTIELGVSFYYDLNATDLSGIGSWEINNTSFFDIDTNGVISNNTFINVGIYWLEVSVNDTYGNTLTDSFKITVQDTTNPSWVQPPSDKVMELGDAFNYDLDAFDLSGIDDWWLNDTMYFDIDGNGVISNVSLVLVGEYWLEVSVNDTNGNTLTDSFKITIQDITSPSWVQPPSDKTIELGISFYYDLNATDLSGIGSWEINDTSYFNIDSNGVLANITSINVGTYWLEVIVNDTYGNTLTGSFKITIQDTTPPSWVQIPLDKIMELGDSIYYDLNASDVSGIGKWWLNNSLYFAINGNGVISNNTFINVGIYWLEVSVNDTYGNILTDSFKITVEDTISPSWSPEPVDQYVDFGDGFYYDLNATDLSGIGSWNINDTTYFNIDNNGVITNITSINVGIYWLEVEVKDTFDNQRTKNLRIIVQDIDSPTWDEIPADKNMEFGSTFAYDLNASDISGIDDWWLNDTTYFVIDDITGVITNIGQVPVGVYSLEVRAYDPYLQYCSANLKIFVDDTIAPTWDEIPADLILEYSEGINYDLNATDASGIDRWWLNDTVNFNIDNITGVITNIGSVPVGIYWLEIAAYDSSNHNCSIIIKVTVQDTISPTWDEIPADLILEYSEGINYDLNATDASGIDRWWLNDTVNFNIDNITGVITNIGPVPVGIYWLEIAAYDPSNHNCSITIKITVQDTTSPTWDEIPKDYSLEYGEVFNYDLNASDASGIDHWWLNDTANFNIDDTTGVITNLVFLEEGIYWLEVRAYDFHGLYCSYTFKVIVTKPMIAQDNFWWIVIIGSSVGIAAITIIGIVFIIIKKKRP